MERETVKIVDGNSASGFREVYRDEIKQGDIKYFDPQIGERPDDSEVGIQIDAGNPPSEPIKTKKGKWL